MTCLQLPFPRTLAVSPEAMEEAARPKRPSQNESEADTSDLVMRLLTLERRNCNQEKATSSKSTESLVLADNPLAEAKANTRGIRVCPSSMCPVIMIKRSARNNTADTWRKVKSEDFSWAGTRQKSSESDRKMR